MTAYRRGADFERRVRADLQDQGWFVLRSAGSRGGFDLIALRPDGAGGCEVRLIQCKVTSRLPRARRRYLAQVASRVGASAWLASRGRANDQYVIGLTPLLSAHEKKHRGGALPPKPPSPMEAEEARLASVQHLAEEFHVPRTTVYGWMRRKGLPYHKVGARVLFDPEEVLAWVHQIYAGLLPWP